MILYISAINDELAHRKPKGPDDEMAFRYWYGWAFFFAGSSFIAAELAAVFHITIYLRRFDPNLDEMSNIIPGLDTERKQDVELMNESGMEDSDGTRNPTIIL